MSYKDAYHPKVKSDLSVFWCVLGTPSWCVLWCVLGTPYLNHQTACIPLLHFNKNIIYLPQKISGAGRAFKS